MRIHILLFNIAFAISHWDKNDVVHAFTPSLPPSFSSKSQIPHSSTVEFAFSNGKSIALITDIDNELILPGERRLIQADDSFLHAQKSMSDDHGIVALGVMGEESEEDLLEMASICEIKEYDENDLDVTVECIGRIKLETFTQIHPYWRFTFSLFEEDSSRLKECRMVADNIEAFMKKLSESEASFGYSNIDTLYSRYKNACKRSKKLDITTDLLSEEIKSLTAISWAAFIALEDDVSTMNLQNYRLKAIDYDTLFDRLKLAQYMLREKELRMQGQKMVLTPKETEKSFGNEDSFQ
jgi:ATP-dependent Lon protease